VQLLSVCLIGTLIVFLLLLIHVASRRWNGLPQAGVARGTKPKTEPAV